VRNTLKLAIATAIAIAAMAATAASASALPAVFNVTGTSTIQASGTLTATWAGQTKTCSMTAANSQNSVTNQGAPSTGTMFVYPLSGNCTPNHPYPGYHALWLVFNTATASKTGSAYSLSVPASPGGQSPFAPFTSNPATAGNAYTVAWTNGVLGGAASKITYNNTNVGTYLGSPITVTGTINITKNGGGLLTLN